MRQRWVLVLSVALCACAPDDEAGTNPIAAAGEPAESAAVREAPDPGPTDNPNRTAPVAEPIAEPAPAAALIAEDVVYGATEQHNLNGYMVLPGGAVDPPAVIMIHEWWGLNDDVRSMARRLAGEGYAVLAVDLFAGETADTPLRAENLMSSVSGERAAVLDNIRQAYRYLDEFVLSSRIGVLGAGLGGRWSLEAATELGEDVDAVVMFYGRIINDDNLLATISAPLLGIFAENDDSIPVRDVQRFRSLLRDLEKSAQVVIYPDVGHGFLNPSAGAFSPDSAEEAWREVVAFLDQSLR
jgi:carboxymethylenebutenolidase